MAEALSCALAPQVEVATSHRPVLARSVTLAVPDMHCGGCMRKVEQALLAVPGVASARANLSERRVTVVTQHEAASLEASLAALEAAGFKATALADVHSRALAAPGDDSLKRLGVAGFAAANIMLLSIAVWSGAGADMPGSLKGMFHWLSAVIALPALTYAAQPFFSSARRALAGRRLNMDVPISLGISLATLMSLYQTVRGSDQVYFDAAITLVFFLLIGRTLDERLRRRARGAAENLLGLRSPAASLVGSGGSVVRVPVADVRPGDRIAIAAGERVPVDARLVDGITEIDESLITGESRPRRAVAGDAVYCGTVNLGPPIEVVATAVADNTLLAEIARLMATAEQARGRYVRLADRAARLYAPAVHILGAATFGGWLLAGQGVEQALTASIAVLIITCPCALALAVPAVQVVAAGRLFRSGVVLKSADGLERLAEVDTIVLDKTGTLTGGEPQLATADTIPPDVLASAAGLAARTRHPYARAVVRAAAERGLSASQVEDAREITGAGMVGRVGDREVRLGAARHCGGEVNEATSTSIWFAVEGSPPIELPMTDSMRADARLTVARLQHLGYAVEVLSGDRAEAVATAAFEAGIAAWRADQRPADKLARLAALAEDGHHVLMVGDGLNDAPALAAGHASVSPANAVDIAQTAADAVLQGEALQPLVTTLLVARAARRRALENFAIAIGYNIVFVPLAVLGLVTPLIAAVAMSASSIAVTGNALRLARGGKETSP